MPAAPASILGLLALDPSRSGSGSREGGGADGFSSLLAVGEQSLEDQRKDTKPQDKQDYSRLVALAPPPTFYAADTTTKIRDIRLGGDVDTNETAALDPQESYDDTLVKPVAPSTQSDHAKTARPEAADKNDKPVKPDTKDVRGTEDNTQNAARPNDAVKAEVEESVPAVSLAASAEVVPVSEQSASGDAITNSMLEKVEALIRDFMAQLQAVQQSGNPVEFATMLQTFFQQLRQILASAGLGVAADKDVVAQPQSSTASLKLAAVELNVLPSAGDGALISKPDVTVLTATVKPEHIQTGALSEKDVLATLKAFVDEQLGTIKTQLPKLAGADPATTSDAQQRLLAQTSQAKAHIDALLSRLTAGMDLAAAQSPVETDVVAATAQAEAPDKGVTANTNTTAASVSVSNAAVTASAGSSNDYQPQGGFKDQASQPLAATSLSASSDAAAKTGQTSFAKLVTRQSQMPLLEQVIFHIKTALNDGSSKIRIQLHPAELGKLDIKLQVGADGKTGVIVTAENKDTLALLQKDASGLERALADAGLKADAGSLSFNLRGDGRERNQEHSQATSHYLKTHPGEEEEALPPEILSRSYVVNVAEGLDIKI